MILGTWHKMNNKTVVQQMNMSRCLLFLTSVKNMWHPTAWPHWWKVKVILASSVAAGRDDAFWHRVTRYSTRTYCSLHHNIAVISLLYCPSHFYTLLFFNALNLSEIYGSVGSAVLPNKRVPFVVTLTSCDATSDFNTRHNPYAVQFQLHTRTLN